MKRMSFWEIRAARSGFEKFHGMKKEKADDAPSMDELDQALRDWMPDGGASVFKARQEQGNPGARDRPVIYLVPKDDPRTPVP
jgi:hypothetical protein